MIKRKRSTAEENYNIIPDYSAIKDDSWGDDANFVQIPKAAVQSVKGKVVVMLYSVRFMLLRNEVIEPLLARDFILCHISLHYTIQHTTTHNTTRHYHMLRNVKPRSTFLSLAAICTSYAIFFYNMILHYLALKVPRFALHKKNFVRSSYRDFFQVFVSPIRDVAE